MGSAFDRRELFDEISDRKLREIITSCTSLFEEWNRLSDQGFTLLELLSKESLESYRLATLTSSKLTVPISSIDTQHLSSAYDSLEKNISQLQHISSRIRSQSHSIQSFRQLIEQRFKSKNSGSQVFSIETFPIGFSWPIERFVSTVRELSGMICAESAARQRLVQHAVHLLLASSAGTLTNAQLYRVLSLPENQSPNGPFEDSTLATPARTTAVLHSAWLHGRHLDSRRARFLLSSLRIEAGLSKPD